MKYYHSDGICISDVVYDVEGEFVKVNDNIKLNKVYYDTSTGECRPYIKVYKHKYYLDEFVRESF